VASDLFQDLLPSHHFFFYFILPTCVMLSGKAFDFEASTFGSVYSFHVINRIYWFVTRNSSLRLIWPSGL
jgi:hypothetical protein